MSTATIEAPAIRHKSEPASAAGMITVAEKPAVPAVEARGSHYKYGKREWMAMGGSILAFAFLAAANHIRPATGHPVAPGKARAHLISGKLGREL